MFSIQVEEDARSRHEFLRIADISIVWKDRAHQKGIVRLLTKSATRKNSTIQFWICHEETILTLFGANGDFVLSIHFRKCDFHENLFPTFSKRIQFRFSRGIAARLLN